MRIKQRLEINMAWMKPVQSLHMLTQLFPTPLDVLLLMDHLCLAFLIIWFSKEIDSCFKVEHVLRDFRKFCCKEDKSRLNYQKTDSLNREFTFLGKVCWLHLQNPQFTLKNFVCSKNVSIGQKLIHVNNIVLRCTCTNIEVQLFSTKA